MTSSIASPSVRTPGSLYARIREELGARILDGTWRPNDPVPSERELMAADGVSRITVRQGLGELQKESLIFRIAGKAPSSPRPGRSRSSAGCRAWPSRWRRAATRPSTACCRSATRAPAS